LALGAFAGIATGKESTILGVVTFYGIYDFIGALFLRALKMIIVPLIASSIITGVAGVGSGKSLGRLGSKTLVYYIATSTLAILTGLLLVNLITPGIQGGEPVRDKLGLTADISIIEQATGGTGAGDLVQIFLRMVPTNPLAAAVEGEILPLIFFCLLFGYFLTRLPDRLRTVLGDFWQAVFEVMMRVTNFVMLAAPFGVFGLVARTTATTGFEAFGPLAVYALTVASALAVHFLITLPLILRLLARVKPTNHYRAVAPALLTAFSTSSSSATLPLTMQCVEKRAGVSNRVTSFVLPLGATVNMDGTALYECVAALFIAQAYGVGLGIGEQFVVVITALLASIGAAGIPSAGLVMITIVLSAVGLPLEGVGLILAVDRILDMTRTMVNVFSDTCGSMVIARSEGEWDFYPQTTGEEGQGA
jgi:proton glutamate symport protein